MVGGALLMIAVVVLAAMLLTGLISGHPSGVSSPAQGAQATQPAAPTTAPTAVPAAPPAAQPPAAPTAIPGFGAQPVTGGNSGGGLVSIASVRAGAGNGYDRFVIDFGNSSLNDLQRYDVIPQGTPTFTTDPKGDQVTLQGSRGVQINVRGISNWMSLPGPTGLQPGMSAIKEARMTGDFEGYVHWSLGVDGPGFVRVMTLTNPARLVVDVQT
jgi:hypothetical protein